MEAIKAKYYSPGRNTQSKGEFFFLNIQDTRTGAAGMLRTILKWILT